MNQFSTCAIRFSSRDILIQREDCFKEASRQIQHAKSNRVFFFKQEDKGGTECGLCFSRIHHNLLFCLESEVELQFFFLLEEFSRANFKP